MGARVSRLLLLVCLIAWPEATLGDTWGRGSQRRFHRSWSVPRRALDPEEPFYVAKNRLDGRVLQRLRSLRKRTPGPATEGTTSSEQETVHHELKATLEQQRLLIDQGRLARVVPNTRVRMLESESESAVRSLRAAPQPADATAPADGSMICKIRLLEGPLKGREVYACSADLAVTYLADPGEAVYLAQPDRKRGGYGALDKASCASYYKAGEREEWDTCLAYLRSGRALYLDTNTRGRVEEVVAAGEDLLYYLRILEGRHQGRRLWVRSDHASLWATRAER